jgi:hypothetical protein
VQLEVHRWQDGVCRSQRGHGVLRCWEAVPHCAGGEWREFGNVRRSTDEFTLYTATGSLFHWRSMAPRPETSCCNPGKVCAVIPGTMAGCCPAGAGPDPANPDKCKPLGPACGEGTCLVGQVCCQLEAGPSCTLDVGTDTCSRATAKASPSSALPRRPNDALLELQARPRGLDLEMLLHHGHR